MKTNNEVFIGEIKQHLSDATPPRHKRTKRLARMIGAGGGLTGLAKGLIVMTVTAALISTMIGTYIVSQTDDIALEGRLSYDLWIDGVPVGGDDFVMPPDTFTDDKLTWEEGQEVFTHTFYSPPDNGNFTIFIDQSWQTWLLPGHEADEFYGYEMKCLDETDTEITSFLVLTGQPAREIQFVHMIDVHFAATSNPLPYSLSLEVDAYNAPPVANPDTSVTIEWGTTAYVNVTGNDIDPENNHLTVTDVTPTNPLTGVTCTVENNMVKVLNNYGLAGSTQTTVTYTISDGHGNTAQATVTLNLHWGG